MESQPQTRYNLKRLRKTTPQVQITLSIDHESDTEKSPLQESTTTNQPVVESEDKKFSQGESVAANFRREEKVGANFSGGERCADKFSEAGSSCVYTATSSSYIQKKSSVPPLARFLSENRKLLEDVAARLYDEVWAEWKNHRVLQISLKIVAVDEMAKINAEYRDVDAATDVLTFPLFEEDGKFTPPCGMTPLPLGDVVICPQIIRENARTHEASEESELALVIFHALLHLLAWDHDTPDRVRKMWQVQEKYRDLFLTRLKEPQKDEETH